jgi:hypothetical protein
VVKVVVAIPFRGDAGILGWTLAGFAQQVVADDVSVEVRVGGDGCAVPALPADTPRVRFVGMRLPRVGSAHAKNLLVASTEGDLVFLGNGDTRPEPPCLQAHVDRHRQLPAGSIVLGAGPYEQPARPTVWDRLMRDTPTMFFYCQMTPGQWYDYRHCWTLNVSLRMTDFRAAGGFARALFPYGYDDLELGYKVMGKRAGLYYDDRAVVVHRHPMTLEAYLDREEMLGLVVPCLAGVNPPMFADLLGTADVAQLAREYAAWTRMDGPQHRWIYRRLQEWMDLPAAALGAPGAAAERTLMTLYQMHIPLKRLAFRLGFLRGVELMDDSRREERVVQGLWRAAVR